jgi:hypothetical protein
VQKLQPKICSKNLSTNVGETEQHLLHHLPIAAIFSIAQIGW